MPLPQFTGNFLKKSMWRKWCKASVFFFLHSEILTALAGYCLTLFVIRILDNGSVGAFAPVALLNFGLIVVGYAIIRQIHTRKSINPRIPEKIALYNIMFYGLPLALTLQLVLGVAALAVAGYFLPTVTLLPLLLLPLGAPIYTAEKLGVRNSVLGKPLFVLGSWLFLTTIVPGIIADLQPAALVAFVLPVFALLALNFSLFEIADSTNAKHEEKGNIAGRCALPCITRLLSNTAGDIGCGQLFIGSEYGGDGYGGGVLFHARF